MTVDQTYIGGPETNRPERTRRHAGRGEVGKAAFASIRDRDTNHVNAAAAVRTDGEAPRSFVQVRPEPDAIVHTDGDTAYAGPPHHDSVLHSVAEYVNGQAGTNGLESFCETLKRGYQAAFHPVSHKHLGGYVNEFAGRHNDRPLDTIDEMAEIVRGLDGKRLRYADLIA